MSNSEVFLWLIVAGLFVTLMVSIPSDKFNDKVQIFTDEETGCQYISAYRKDGMYPRIDQWGHIMGCRGA